MLATALGLSRKTIGKRTYNSLGELQISQLMYNLTNEKPQFLSIESLLCGAAQTLKLRRISQDSAVSQDLKGVLH